MDSSAEKGGRYGLRIGIDVGGTNTDAVLIRGRDILAATKQRTTADVTSGVTDAIQAILEESNVPPSEITAVMVGTTHFVNAFVQRKELQPVAILRIGLPMTSGIPPLVDWPDELRDVVGEHIYMIGGGSYYTGVDYAPLDKDAIKQAAAEIENRGLTAAAISSVFAPIRPDLESQAEEILREVLGDIHVTLSHQVGGIGLVERENAAIINATLHRLADKVVSALEGAIDSLGMNAQLYLTQNDGTLMGTESARQYPVTTCSAGPTNSIRGAAFLSQSDNAIVVDIGGTTTDVGVLAKGLARETSESFDLGGVRTNFSMPDVLSIGLGGGTVVRMNDDEGIELGPESVGFRLLEEAQVFGGSTLTTTDIAVARGQIALGDASLVSSMPMTRLDAISRLIHQRVESAIDQLKTSATDIPVILVGGGSVLVDGDLQGASEVIKPEHGTVANAIGAAIAQVGGRVKRLFDFSGEGGRDAAIAQATEEARANAIAAGAAPDSLHVVDIEEYPMPYMQSDAVDVRVRVVGELGSAVAGDGA